MKILESKNGLYLRLVTVPKRNKDGSISMVKQIIGGKRVYVTPVTEKEFKEFPSMEYARGYFNINE